MSDSTIEPVTAAARGPSPVDAIHDLLKRINGAFGCLLLTIADQSPDGTVWLEFNTALDIPRHIIVGVAGLLKNLAPFAVTAKLLDEIHDDPRRRIRLTLVDVHGFAAYMEDLVPVLDKIGGAGKQANLLSCVEFMILNLAVDDLAQVSNAAMARFVKLQSLGASGT